jgi:hypothetical protein
MQSAIRQKIFDCAPGVVPVKILSLMSPASGPEPKAFGDFLPLHNPDRRAHEVFAICYSLQKESQKSEEMLQALEPAEQAQVRASIARINGGR